MKCASVKIACHIKSVWRFFVGEIQVTKIILVVLAALAIAPAFAGEVTVGQAWSRATAPGQDSGVVTLHILSQHDARLVAVSSPASASAEIHRMTHENGVMKMRQLDALALPAKRDVVLGNDGNHLMLLGLKKPLQAGETLALMLTVRFADQHEEKIEVSVEIKPLTESHEAHHHHH